jgi:putative intracellular protease/amidase
VEGVDLKASAMTNRSPDAVRSLVALRRLARGLGGVGLSAAGVAGVAAAGAVVSMREAHPRTPQAAPAQGWPPTRSVPEGRLAVAVVLGASGSVITDALGPYEVFARSPKFFVYTVSASRPTAVLSGGLAVVPDYSLDDVDAGLAPEPDVVVVPAVAGPNGRKEAPLREWIARRVDRGAHLLGVCNGSRLLAAAGLLDGRRATAHWSSIRSLERRRPQVDWVRGQRYVQDGTLTTTAGVTSGVFGALRLVEQLAGAGEAQRVARSSPTRAGRFTAPPRSVRSDGGQAIWRTCWLWSSRGGAQRSASAWSRGSASWRSPPPSRSTPAPSRPAPSRSPPRPPSPPDTGCA